MRGTCSICDKWNPQDLKAKGEDKQSNATQHQHGILYIEMLLHRNSSRRPLHGRRTEDARCDAHMHVVSAPLAPTLAHPSVDDVRHATPQTPRPATWHVSVPYPNRHVSGRWCFG